MFWRRLPVAIALSLLYISVATAQTGQENYPFPPAAPGPPRVLSPPDTSDVKAPPKPYSSSNTTNATARHLIPDGSWEQDEVDSTNTQAWFSFPIYYEHTYVIEVLVPYNYNAATYNVPDLDFIVYENDGTTAFPTLYQRDTQPNLSEQGYGGGQRRALSNFGSDRFVHLQVHSYLGNPLPASGIYFHIRVIDLTQTAARWTVNGYNMYIALNNTSRQLVEGYVDYFDQAGNLAAFESFSLGGDASVQLFHASGVTLGGAVVGGIRVIPTRGAPGAIAAHEYNFNPGIGQYLSFPFNQSPWRYGTPAQ
jgi:hypothetical protein